jgi:hypothetical protein
VKVKGKNPLFLLQGSFINSRKQGGAAVLGEGLDIVTGETCIPAALNRRRSCSAFFCFVARAVPVSAYR